MPLRRPALPGAAAAIPTCPSGHATPAAVDRGRLQCWGPRKHFVFDREATSAVHRGARAVLDSRPYVLPAELEVAGGPMLEQVLASGHAFDGPVIGLATDVHRAPAPLTWVMSPSSYFDLVRSDLLAARRWTHDLDGSLLQDRDGALLGHGGSPLLNAIGASTLAVTTDGHVVVVRQGAVSHSSPGLLVPSGSGTMEPRDFGSCRSVEVSTLAARSSVRELAEETGIDGGDVVGTAFLGYARWIEMAAKPELFSLTMLSIDSAAVLERRRSEHDEHYIEAVHTAALAPRDQWDAERPAQMLPEVDSSAISAPLLAALALLADTPALLPHGYHP